MKKSKLALATAILIVLVTLTGGALVGHAFGTTWWSLSISFLLGIVGTELAMRVHRRIVRSEQSGRGLA